jgi:hypothetical protein
MPLLLVLLAIGVFAIWMIAAVLRQRDERPRAMRHPIAVPHSCVSVLHLGEQADGPARR